MPKKSCTYCGKLGGDHRACIEAWGLDCDFESELEAQAYLDRRKRIMTGETIPTGAGAYAKENRVGQTIYTHPMGEWPGGLCEVIGMSPDPEGAPEIVMQVRRVEDGDTCGVYDYETVEILVGDRPVPGLRRMRRERRPDMKILQSAGSYELLTPPEELQRQLLNIERAGRTCYKSERAGRTCYKSERGEITEETAARFVRMLLARGHESVIEHTLLTVRFTGVSRGFTHENRLCAFSQESTRYVDYACDADEKPDLDRFELRVVCPPHRNPDATVYRDGLDINPEACLVDVEATTFRRMCREAQANYRALRKAGWSPEDARQILPNGITSDIVVSANWREWRHIFTLRTGKAAHWEIRAVMVDLLQCLQGVMPAIFSDFHQAGRDGNGAPYYTRGV